MRRHAQLLQRVHPRIDEYVAHRLGAHAASQEAERVAALNARRADGEQTPFLTPDAVSPANSLVPSK